MGPDPFNGACKYLINFDPKTGNLHSSPCISVCLKHLSAIKMMVSILPKIDLFNFYISSRY